MVMNSNIESPQLLQNLERRVYDLFSKGRFAWVVDDKDEVKLIINYEKSIKINDYR